MEESVVTFSTKTSKKRKFFLTKNKHSQDDRTSTNSQLSLSSRLSWKNFFSLLLKHDVQKDKRTHFQEYNDDVYLDEIEDDLAMAIFMPNYIKGKDVQITIELQAINGDTLREESGAGKLEPIEITPYKATFCGNLIIPNDTTIEQISQMPLYFINSEEIIRPVGTSHKIETVIKPLEDNLPDNIDRNMIINSINLKTQFKYTKKIKLSELSRKKSLYYTFLVAEKKELQNSFQKLSSREEETNMVVEADLHNTNSPNLIVKEILYSIVNKISDHNNISTQYSNMITSVSKQIDVQKSLVFPKNTIEEQNVMSLHKQQNLQQKVQIYSEDSLYPITSTTNTTYTLETPPIIADSGNSMFYLKAPTNTPNMQNPKYIIKCDSKMIFPDRKFPRHDDVFFKVLQPKRNDDVSCFGAKMAMYCKPATHIYKKREKQKGIDENLRADIDKTLDLLESAKNRLINYLDPDDLDPDRKRKNKYEKKSYDIIATESCSVDKIAHRSPPISDRKRGGIRKDKTDSFRKIEKKNKIEKDSSGVEFFRENTKKEEVFEITSSNKTVEETLEKDEDRESLLQKRYSGDGEKLNLTYSIVVNDIDLMIKELLAASKDIKELAIKSMDLDNSPKDESDDEIKEDVTILMNTLLDTIENSFEGDLSNMESTKQIQNPLLTNYCDLDDEEMNKPDLIEVPEMMIYENKSHLEEQFATVTVKRSTIKNNLLKNDEGLVERLEKDVNFLSEICQEVFSKDGPQIEMKNKNQNSFEVRNITPNKEKTKNLLNEDETSRNITNPQNVEEEDNEISNEDLEKKNQNFYLKPAEKIEKKRSVERFESSAVSQIEELIINTSVQPLTIAKNQPKRPISSSSSSEEIRSTHKSRNVKKTTKIPTDMYPSSSDYDADKEGYSNMVLPNFKQEYVSLQELNNAKEIKYIEENVATNQKLNVPEESSETTRPQQPYLFLLDSTESINVSESLESEESIIISKYLENDKHPKL